MQRYLLGALIVATALVCLFAPALAQVPTADWREGFRAHDKNGDGRIDRAEFHDWMVEAFYFRDKGHKGYLVPADLQGTVSSEVFKAINRKGDGRLTMREYLNALFQDFAVMDVNHNGAVTAEEIDAYIKRAAK
jgi:Ca2+-binding EF-hand superfamily protein